MSFDWSEYLNLAQELAGQAVGLSCQEAKSRSAISRAYYAAYCKARNHLRSEGHAIPRGGQAHTYVRDQFKNSPYKVRKGVGAHLNRLRKDRNQADYDDTVTRLSAKTKKALRLAKVVISKLSSL